MATSRALRLSCQLAALLVATSLLAACPQAPMGDCSLVLHGRLTECGNGGPISGATVSVHVDDGSREYWDDRTWMTAADGKFDVSLNACDAFITLMFEKPGFKALTTTPSDQSPLCMTRE
jgi:hypothetical protein